MDSELSVDPRTFNTGEDAQVSGQPRRVWGGEGEKRGRNEFGGQAVLGQKPLKRW